MHECLCTDPTATPTQFLTLPEAAAHLGAGGKKPSTATLWRWCRKGCRGVRLEYSRYGREIRVTPQALVEFGHALAAVDRELPSATPATPMAPSPAKTAKRTPAQLARDLEQARRDFNRPSA